MTPLILDSRSKAREKTKMRTSTKKKTMLRSRLLLMLRDPRSDHYKLNNFKAKNIFIR